MAEHTPGPWSYYENYEALCGGLCDPRGCQGHASGLYELDGPEQDFDFDGAFVNEADARIISASPEMLEALDAYKEWNNHLCGDCENGNACEEGEQLLMKANRLREKAMSKAEGEA